MKRRLSALAAVLAVAVGVWLRPAASPTATLNARDAAAAWATANGLTLQRSEKLTALGIYMIHHFSAGVGCTLRVVPLGNPDEILPELNENVTEAQWQTSRLLLVTATKMPRTALGVHAQRLLARLVDGRAPQPVMLIAPPPCVNVAHLQAWPAQ